ncbi:XRE family transcriptional regulator, partial [Vibrio anguillarum]|nr:XRE family transcriptional regulator [Vibrio anguillarum]
MSRESLVRAIKKRRNLAGLTQDEVAELCGMSKKTYQRIE